jgi:hypothetical protein
MGFNSAFKGLTAVECWTFREELIAVDGKASGHDRRLVPTLHLLTGTEEFHE